MSSHKPLHQYSAGKKDPTTDYFADVRRALDSWLMKNDATYRKNSEAQSARVKRIQERRTEQMAMRHGFEEVGED